MKLRRVVSFIIAMAILLSMMPAVSLPTHAATSGATVDTTGDTITADVTIGSDGAADGGTADEVTDDTALTAPEKIINKAASETTDDAATAATAATADAGATTAETTDVATRGTSVATRAATSGTTGACTWTLNGTELTISGNGAMANYTSSSAAPWSTSITKVTIESGVTNVGNYAFRNCTNLTSVTIPASVTGIGYYAFYNCSSLTEVTIPDSVTNIENYTFYNCKALTSVTIGKNVTSIANYAFGYCSSLTNVTIPDSVTSIGDSVFYYCSSLTSVTIGNGVTSIGRDAFYSCSKLTEVHIADFAAWYQISFYNYFSNPLYYAKNLYLNGVLVTELVIPEDVTTVGNYTFYGCSSLTSVIIPDGVTSIGSYAFNTCSNLTSVIIGNGVTKIGSYAFSGCSKLAEVHITDVAAWCQINFVNDTANPLYYAKKLYLNNTLVTELVIPDGVTTIGNRAFYNCGSLTSVTIPDSVTSIGDYAFNNCSSLTSVTIGAGVTSIGDRAFNDCSKLTEVHISDIEAWCRISFTNYFSNPVSYAGKLYLNDALVTDVVIPEGVTEIGNEAFYNCQDLKSIIIPEGVTSIGSNAFYNCSKLAEVTIPSGVTKISGYAFYGCSSLSCVSIPEGVKSIGYYAFAKCSSLTNITIPDSVTSIGTSVLSGCSGLQSITIPFVGNARKAGTDTYQYPLGYIFGTSSYTGGVSTSQSYYGSSTSTLTTSTYYIPSGLMAVTVTGGNLLYGAFYNCDDLTRIAIGDGVSSIYSNAFYSCSNLARIQLPVSITYIDQYAFRACGELERVYYAGTQAQWKNIYIVLSNNTELLEAERIYEHPGGFVDGFDYKIIDGKATISGYYSLSSQNLVIPTEIKGYPVVAIGEAAFRGCTELTGVTIPAGVTCIEKDAFYGCSKLTEVCISDLSAWCKIDFSNLYANPVYYAKTLYLNDTQITRLEIPGGTETIGDYAFAYCTGLTNVSIPDSVTGIGDYAFYKCSSLTGLTIPDKVAGIGEYAFYECSSLTGVTTGDGVSTIGRGAFSGCNNLTSVTIGNGVSTIGNVAFSSCGRLTSVTIGDSVASIGTDAFSYCNNLTAVHITDVAAWCRISFADYSANPLYHAKNLYLNGTLVTDLVIPEGVTSIAKYAFYDCSSLTSVTIPASLTSIDNSAFSYCFALTGVYITDVADWCKVNFGDYSANPLYNAENLYVNGALVTNLVIPDGVTSISSKAFYNCKSLTGVTIPSSLAEIASEAFNGCEKLTDVYITDLKAWCQISFADYSANPLYYVYNGKNLYVNGALVTDLVIPEGVTYIGDFAFNGCISLTSVVIGNDVTTVGSDAFYNCDGITSVTIGDNVTTICDRAFDACNNLTEVRILESVTGIGRHAFARCGKLARITLPVSITNIDEYAFSSCSKLQKVYYNGSQAQWNKITISSSGNDYLKNAQLVLDQDSGYTGGIDYKIVDGEAIIIGGYAPSDGNLVIPDTIHGYPVVSIEKGAFSGCTGLKHVTIPESVTEIWEGAFSGCTSLQSITIPFVGHKKCTESDPVQFPLGYIFGTTSYTGGTATTQNYYNRSYTTGVYSTTYYIPSSLRSVTVTGGEILRGAFENCSMLTDITLNEGVTNIVGQSFTGCTGVTSLNIPGSVTNLGEFAFSGLSNLTDVTIGEGVTGIGNSAFTSCKKLTTIVIPDSVTSIGSSAFSGLTALTTVTLGSNVANIGANAFYGCSKLTDIELPASVQTIGTYAFYNCSALTEINIPAGVKTVGTYAFSGCSKLEAVYITDLAKWCEIAFNDYNANPLYLAKKLYLNGERLSGHITIPNGTTKIGNHAFRNCLGVTGFTIPASVTTIGDYAFSACSITGITIPEGVTSIGKGAFYSCGSLVTVSIPDSVTSVGQGAFPKTTKMQYTTYKNGKYLGNANNPYLVFVNRTSTDITSCEIHPNTRFIMEEAFSGCTSLTKLEIPEGVLSIGYRAFYNCSSLTSLTIPASVQTISANWLLYGCGSLVSLTLPFIGNSRITAQDDYQYPLGNLFGTSTYTGAVAVKQTYYYYSDHLSTYTYYIPSSLKTLTVTDSQILYGAFMNCSKLSDITIGSGVTDINKTAFEGCSGLQRIEVGAENPNYCSSSGILYNKSKTEVIWAPANQKLLFQVNYTYASGETAFESIKEWKKSGEAYSAQIPEILGYSAKITEISGTMPEKDLVIDVIYYENAKLLGGQCGENIQWTLYADGTLVFRGIGAMYDYTSGKAPWAASAEQIKEVYIDARITTIGAYAFENCTKLTFVDYGYSVSSIGAYAFSGCTSLQSFKLPVSVTEISEGSFSGCAGLKAVVIPDNITVIGSGAFAGCSQLVQATVGADVQSIGQNAFADCGKLTQIYFRGEPSTLGDKALGDTADKYVYYYTSVSGWSDVITDGRWNGYLAVPYNALSKEKFDGTNVYIIKVVDKHNAPLENAVVTLGKKVQPTNQDGMAYFVKPTDALSLSVSCSNHITFSDSAFQASATQIMDVIELSDRPSVVQGVRVNQDSIATSVKIVNCSSDESLKIAVSGYSKYKIIRYELHQGSRLITTVTTDAQSCTFSVKASAFEEGQTVLVKMYTSDGQMVASALNIDVIKLADISEQQILSEISQLELAVGLGSMGDYKIPVSFAAKGEEKIYAIVSGRTIRVGINLDIDAFKEKDEQKAKTALHKMVDDSMKNFAKGKTGLEYNLCGYVEIEYLGNGEYYIKSSYVKVGLAATLGFKAQASYFGIVGVYFKLSLTAQSTLALTISRFEPEAGFKIDELIFAMEATLGIEGGVYLLWGIGSAGIYGKATMGFELGVIPDVEFKSVYITGEFGVTWSVLWGLYSDSYVIAAGDIYRWPDPQTNMAKRLAERVYAAQQDPNSYTPNDRAYLENRSQWLDGKYLQKNIYENVAPQIVTCGDTTMMLWLDDNADRDAANFQTLYYSVYTDGTWSEPMPVDDNGTFDCEFDVYTHGDKLYVVYTEMVAKNSAIATLDVADESAVTDFAGGVEVFVTVYENGNFGASVQLTDNEACELLPRIAIADGKVTASWIETEMVTITGQTGNNALYTAVLGTTGWSDPAAYIDGQNTVSDVEIVTLGDESYTVYLVDADGSGETKDDQSLILGDGTGEMTALDSGFITNAAPAVINGTTVLTWQNNGTIYMISQPDQKPVCLLPDTVSVDANYEIVSISKDETLLTFVMNNYDSEGNVCDGTDIYGIFINENGAVTDPVRLTRTEGYVNNYSAIFDEKLVLVFTETFASVDGENVKTVAHLRSDEIEFVTDLSLISVEHDQTAAEKNTEYELVLQLRNNGLMPINSVAVRFCETGGRLLYTANCDVQLAAGAAGECTAVVVLPAELTTGGYTIQVLPGHGGENDLSDNIQTLEIGYADFAVAAEQKIIGEKNYISMTVSNVGNVSATAMLEIYAPNASGRKLTDISTEQIAPGATEQYFVELDALLNANESQVTCVAVCEDDPYYLNNTQTLTLLRIDDSAFVTDPDQVISNPELSVNAVTYDKYAPQDVAVLITAEAEYFAGIDGLVKGTHYTMTANEITIKSDFVSGLDIGAHTLRFVFDFGYEEPVVRTLNITVTDSTPELLSGEIAISGDAAVGSTVYADVSGLKPENAKVTYQWTIDGTVVSNLAFYEISQQDMGKELKLTVCGVSGFTGEFSAEKTVAARLQNAPSAPIISKTDSFSFTVAKTEGVEYSIDLVTWQISNVFTGLTPNTTYTVYARKAATETAAASAVSYGVQVTTPKATVDTPDAPEILMVWDTSILLVQVEGIEYSMDKENWQSSGLFEGLEPNRSYSFYARKAETESTYASAISVAAVAMTKKSTVEAPDAPVVVSRGDTTVTLQWYEGYEYSMDGITWQNEVNAQWYGCHRFTDLSPNTEYTFYQRVAETQTCYASAISEPLVIRTWKSQVSAPSKPVVAEVLPDSIILEANEQYQYKLVPYTSIITVVTPSTGTYWGTAEEPTVETQGWQDSNIFVGLEPNTKYTCYQRYKGTDVAYASYASDPIHVTTDKYTPDKAATPVLESVSETAIALSGLAGYEYSMDGVNWQDEPVFTNLQPDTQYTFYQRTKETDTHYTSPMSDGVVVRTYRLPIVTAVVGGQTVSYRSVAEAVAGVPENSTLQLICDVQEDIIISKNLCIDLNGFDLTANITVESNAKLSLKDSQTDDYTVMDGAGYGKLIGTVAGVQAANGYMMITEEDGISFHKVDLQLKSMVVRPSAVGVYYTCNFAGDELVAQNVERYGVALSVAGVPNADALGICSWYDNFQAGSAGNAASGTLLKGIMKTDNTTAENMENAAMAVYGRAYLLTKDGAYIFGDSVSRTFRQQMEDVDLRWQTLTEDQKNAVLSMYETYEEVMCSWEIPNILAAVK